MQFRTRTLFVILTTMGVIFAVTTRSHIALRLGLAFCVAMVWTGFGLAGSSLRKSEHQRGRNAVLCLFGIAIAATALSVGVVLAGTAFRLQFVGPLDELP